MPLALDADALPGTGAESPNVLVAPPANAAVADEIAKGPQQKERAFSPVVLNIGFLFALLISASCLAFSAVYLQKYLDITSGAVTSIIQQTTGQTVAMQVALSARLAVAKFSLLSCGVVAGLAFGFLGFGLFLLGIQGAMDAQVHNSTGGIQLVRVAPGTFVIVCAAILIGISVTHEIEFSAQQEPTGIPTRTRPAYSAPEIGHDAIP
jgi:hypothetical protein